GLAGATFAKRLLPGLDALFDAFPLLLAFLVRFLIVGIRCRRGESGPCDGAGVLGGSRDPHAEQTDDEDRDHGTGQKAESLTGGCHQKPSTYRRRILQRPDRRSLRRGPGLENVAPG